MLPKFFRVFPSNTGHRLLRDLVLLVLLITGAILAAAVFHSSRERKDISRSLITQITERAGKEFRQLQEPVERILALSRQWGKAGLFDFKDVRTFNAKFAPVLEQAPQVSSMMIASSDGVEYLLLRDSDQWLTRLAGIARGDRKVQWTRWKNDGQPVAEWREELDYDPRSRPWYRGAIESVQEGEIFWTEPYVFYTTRDPGITASTRWQTDEEKGKTFVIACDLLLNDVFRWISDVRVSEKGKAFLLDHDGRLFAPREGGRFPRDVEEKKEFYVSAEKLGDPAISAAVRSWKKSGRISDEPIKFTSEGRTWWGGFRPLDPERRSLWIGVAVPEKDFFGQLRRGRYLISVVVVIILAVGITAAALVVRKYRHQLKEGPIQILKAGNLEEKLKSLVASGESSTLEFKSSMRMNLNTGKFGKEIELAWLKTLVAFLNTDGGTLLIGLADDGEIVGLEADEFRNEDSCRLHFKNLIGQHIGLEFSKYLNFDIKPLNGKSIAIIECERSKNPAFLKNNKEEDFFIRTGPSSVKLSTSKVLKYQETRK